MTEVVGVPRIPSNFGVGAEAHGFRQFGKCLRNVLLLNSIFGGGGLAGVHDPEGETLTFFGVNRHSTEALPVTIALQGFGAATVIDHQVVTHAMLDAVNTATDQTNVAPQKATGATIGEGSLRLTLKPLSYAMIRVKLA